MSDVGCAETPLKDHVARFWRHLETETVRIVVDLKRTVGIDAPDGPTVYWDGASFSDDVAKALVADRDARVSVELLNVERETCDRIRTDNDRLRAALTETLAEVVEIRKNITDARQHNYEAIAHPKFDETYQREMARMDAMIERARNALTHEQKSPQRGVIFLTGAFSDHLDSKFKDEQTAPEGDNDPNGNRHLAREIDGS